MQPYQELLLPKQNSIVEKLIWPVVDLDDLEESGFSDDVVSCTSCENVGPNDDSDISVVDEIISVKPACELEESEPREFPDFIPLTTTQSNSSWIPSKESNVLKPNHFRLFECSFPYHRLVVLHLGGIFPFHGWLEYSVLFGACEIFGYEKQSCSWTEYENLQWTLAVSFGIGCPTLYFEHKQPAVVGAHSASSELKLHRLKWKLKKLCDDSTVNEIIGSLSDESCCILVRNAQQASNTLGYVRSVYSNIFSNVKLTLKEVVPNAFAIKSHSIKNSKLFRKYESKEESNVDYIVAELENTIKTQNRNYVVVVAGKVNSGKSTFSRYFINKTLQLSVPFYHLDCDCGQTEFNLPGCLSLTKIDAPVFGDPFGHLKQSELCYYFGNFSPSELPDEYIRLIRELKTYFDTLSRNNPSVLFVNTNGWVTGFGAELLICILDMMKGDRIICVGGGDASLFTILKSYSSRHSISTSVIGDTSGSNSEVMTKNGALLRELCISAYFGQLLPKVDGSDASLSCLVPYVVSWNRVKVGTVGGWVPPEYLMSLLNGNVVALGRSRAENSTRDEGTINDHWMNELQFPLFVPDNAFPVECLGFGVIRAVDMERKLFYVLTPVPPEKLQTVDVLLKGKICLPSKLLVNENLNVERDSIFVLKKKRNKIYKVAHALGSTLRMVTRYKKKINKKHS